ncbi:MAG: hypothetical protein ACOVQK_07825 [Cyanobium sp.]|jgi:hypothetical protein
MITETAIPEGKQDGFLSCEGGVDSGRDPSLLPANMMAEATNTSFRGGIPKPRPGVKRINLAYESSAVEALFSGGLFQGAGGYVALDGSLYITLSISGEMISIPLGSSAITATKLSLGTGVNDNSPVLRKAWFVQADQYQIIQDGQSRPIIWDGAGVRRAYRNEVPTGGPMAYGLGRLWVGRGRDFVGGDIIYGDPAFGTANVLRFTDNDVIAEGGAFTVPWQSGEVTGLSFSAKTDTASGEGSLMVFTANGVFEFDAPTDRTQWQNLQQPIQRFALLRNGAESHESITQVNGDLFFRSTDGIRSFYFARRDWNTWANTPVSREVEPIMSHDDRGLLYWSSSINFDNRLITTTNPVATERGVVWRSCVALDFDLVSTIKQKVPPAWDGKWVLTDRVLQLVTVQNIDGIRAFVIGLDENDYIGIWEITRDEWTDDGADIQWELVTKSYQFDLPLTLKMLKSAEMWMSELSGNVAIDAFYKSDVKGCWSPWARWAQNFDVCKSVPNRAIGCLPTLFSKPPVKTRVALPEPEVDPTTVCGSLPYPSTNGYEFQVRLKMTGHLKMRKLRVLADERFENEFGEIDPDCDTTNLVQNECEACSNA